MPTIRPKSLALVLSSFLVVSVIATSAAAQSTPEGLLEGQTASSGETELDPTAFDAAQKLEEEKDTTEFELSAGGLFATGNAESLAITSSSRFRLRRGMDQLSAATAVNYAQAAQSGEDALETTVENYQGKIRYDRFLTESFATFLGVTARHDRFQGLDLRLNVDPGVAYYFIDAEKHQLWGEVGYDLQYDIRRQENIDAAEAEGETVEKSVVRHSARLFAGYDNKLNDRVSFNTSAEYIQSVTQQKNWRLNVDAGITANIVGRLSTATTFTLRYDNNPLPDVETTDTMTSVNLVYTLL